MLCWFNQHVFRSISIACNQITITYIDISWERSFKDDLLLWQTKALLVPSHTFHTQTLGCIAKAELSCSERSCYEGRWRLPSPLFFFSKMMTSPQRAGSFLSRAVGPGTSSKTISLSANTSLPQYILLLLHSERLCCGNRRPRQNGWSSVTHSALMGRIQCCEMWIICFKRPQSVWDLGGALQANQHAKPNTDHQLENI